MKGSQKSGLPPGSLIHVGEKKVERVKITLINYDHDNFEEKEIVEIKDSLSYVQKQGVTWINIEGLHDEKIIESIGKAFEINHLTLEDIMNTSQRAKVEDFESYLFFVLKAVFPSTTGKKIHSENLSIILGENFVLSFEEKQTKVFNNIKERIRTSAGRIRRSGCDYLAYALIDAIVDDFFSAIEFVGKGLENLEGEVIKNPSKKTMNKIYGLKREVIFLLRILKPVREMISRLERDRPKIISDETFSYFRDVYDHVLHQVETLDTYSQIQTGFYQMYLSSVNYKMNEVMKVLTLTATIFIPLTFVTGIYGMNFVYMPELEIREAYFQILTIMAVIAISMVVVFKHKKWI